MLTKLQNLIKLLLDLHKALLDLERENYEKKNGPISNNNEYFGIVINHEDFQWLRKLSEAIALIDEEAEQDIINAGNIKEISGEIKELLSVDNDDEFSQRYQSALENNRNIFELDKQVKLEL